MADVFLLNGVRVTTTTGGTGALQIAGSAPGYLEPFAAGGLSGRTYSWRRESEDGATWEVFDGTLTAASPATISRDVVWETSTGNAVAINWPAGTVTYVTCVALAEHLVYGRASLGWERIASSSSATPMQGVVFSLPTGYRRYRLTMSEVVGSVPATLLMQVSVNGGSSYLDSVGWSHIEVRSSAVLSNAAVWAYVPLFPPQESRVTGQVLIPGGPDPAAMYDTAGLTGTSKSLSRITGAATWVGTATHILIGFLNAQVQYHWMVLEGQQ